MSFDEFIKKGRIELNWRNRVSDYVRLQKDLKDYSIEQYCKNEGIDQSAFKWWLEYISLEDKFTYYRSFATEYLGRAKRALDLLEHYIDLDPKLRMPLMRDSIISYAALFRKSNGRVRIKWSLEAQIFVPQHLQEVHNKICTDRDIIIAHCDLGPRNPKVSLIGISLCGKGFYWDDYKALLPHFKELIEAVLKNLESYSAKMNLSSAEEAFQDFSDPPPTALKDPGSALINSE